jgi:hypothetical protein
MRPQPGAISGLVDELATTLPYTHAGQERLSKLVDI